MNSDGIDFTTVVVQPHPHLDALDVFSGGAQKSDGVACLFLYRRLCEPLLIGLSVGARVKIPVGFAGIDFITVLHNFRHLRKLSLPPFLDIRHIDIFEYLGQHKLKLEHVELHTLFPITSRPSQQFMLKPFKDVKRDRQRKKRSADFYARKIRKLRTLSWRASRTSKDKSLKPVFSLYGSFRLESLSLSNIIVEFSEICEKNVVMWSLHTLRLIGCGLLSRDCHTIARAFPRLRVLNLENNELVATSAIELVISGAIYVVW